jgi:hypothetical protein
LAKILAQISPDRSPASLAQCEPYCTKRYWPGLGNTIISLHPSFQLVKTLSRAIWAQFDNLGIGANQDDYTNRVLPDGICLDREGGIWVVLPGLNGISEPAVLRIREGGEANIFQYSLCLMP